MILGWIASHIRILYFAVLSLPPPFGHSELLLWCLGPDSLRFLSLGFVGFGGLSSVDGVYSLSKLLLDAFFLFLVSLVDFALERDFFLLITRALVDKSLAPVLSSVERSFCDSGCVGFSIRFTCDSSGWYQFVFSLAVEVDGSGSGGLAVCLMLVVT